MKWILASGSPRRKELFQLLVPKFDVIVPQGVQEKAIKETCPERLVQTLAKMKCLAVAQHQKDACVIGCDTIVFHQGTVYGKPENKEHARQMLTSLSADTHEVYTGVCIASKGNMIVSSACTKVTFAALTAQEIEDYLRTEEPYDKAGAYAIQGGAAKWVSSIQGCYFNVVGFPVAHVYQMIKKL